MKISNLSYSYDDKVYVLDDIEVDLQINNIYYLIGNNGAGKTTFFNCITGIFDTSAFIEEKDFFKNIFYVHDNIKMYENLTGNEFVKLLFELDERTLNEATMSQLSEAFLIDNHLDDLIRTYSLGTKQKLMLMIGILLETKYLFLDEPFKSLDVRAIEEVINILNNIKKDRVIIISTHRIEIVSRTADIVWHLNNGKIIIYENQMKLDKILNTMCKQE